ncbi:MAG: DNA translocase FtsK 4TM domain-containing protein, partial [Victivallales bacterium]|nr:DNA translocase FtsK 4TM domain-containing protein [Victivallales bacterium]
MALHTQTASNSESSDVASPELAQRDFKFRRIVILGILLVAIFAMVPFFPADLDYYAGGLGPEAFPRNHLGAIGAYFGWFMLVTFGLSSYLLLMLALLCSLRRLLWRGKLRRSSPSYFLAIPLFSFGTSLLLGLTPDAFSTLTSSLNIAQMPGGVTGHLFCAPGSGWLFVLLNYTGCLLIAVSIILVSLSIIWLHDWSELTRCLAQHLQRNSPLDEQSSNVNTVASPAEGSTEAPQDNSRTAREEPAASPVLTRPRTGGFQGRRSGGLSTTPSPSLQSHPTYDPVAPKPAPQQPELPSMQPADTYSQTPAIGPP